MHHSFSPNEILKVTIDHHFSISYQSQLKIIQHVYTIHIQKQGQRQRTDCASNLDDFVYDIYIGAFIIYCLRHYHRQ